MAKNNEKTLAQIGEITFRLEQFNSQLDELKVFPEKEKAEKMKEEVLAYAGTLQFAKNALRGHKEAVGTLLINILELEDTFK